MPRGWYDDSDPRTTRREAKGGIKAASVRGAFGQSWWAKRWIQVLEGFNMGARLNRGRSYARSGQVLSIEMDMGQVTADVQGSRKQPYHVVIQVQALTGTQWKKVAEAMSRQAHFAARLLAGDMPDEVEQVFTQMNLSLFPGTLQDLKTDCSCPDWSNPCKHIAAVYYLLGVAFDADPFLIFKMRGMDRDGFMDLLRNAGAMPLAEVSASLDSVPLASDPTLFWHGGILPKGVLGEISIPPVDAVLPQRLGNMPFWRGDKPLQQAVVPIYAPASRRGLEVFIADGSDTQGQGI
ncbi:MAG: SWIM zinc finger family protein [Magnetococcus sp. WYHC-3]